MSRMFGRLVAEGKGGMLGKLEDDVLGSTLLVYN